MDPTIQNIVISFQGASGQTLPIQGQTNQFFLLYSNKFQYYGLYNWQHSTWSLIVTPTTYYFWVHLTSNTGELYQILNDKVIPQRTCCPRILYVTNYALYLSSDCDYWTMSETMPVIPTSFTGPTGPLGTAGARGVTGSSGATGAKGVTGPVGATGYIGHTGAQGTIGATGYTRITRIDGYTWKYRSNGETWLCWCNWINWSNRKYG